jgi:RNA polymerase sigma factor (sigma-70 family)
MLDGYTLDFEWRAGRCGPVSFGPLPRAGGTTPPGAMSHGDMPDFDFLHDHGERARPGHLAFASPISLACMLAYNRPCETRPPMSGAATTRWSLILAARGTSPSAQEALSQLCQDYRPVVLAFFRRQQQPQLADDRTQAFFLHFLDRHLHDRADATRGSFRAFLFTSVRNHWREALRNDAARKRQAGPEVGEAALEDVADTQSSPEHLFDRDWALHVLRRARDKLQQEAVRSGKATLFASVQDFLIEPPEASDYVRIGTALGIPANTIAVAVRRMRERLRALVRRELADTLPPAADLETEMQWLKRALRRD